MKVDGTNLSSVDDSTKQKPEPEGVKPFTIESKSIFFFLVQINNICYLFSSEIN